MLTNVLTTPSSFDSSAADSFDVLIVGGGLVGLTLALALSDQPLKIAVIEAKMPETSTVDNDRALALSLGSWRILKTLGLESSLQAFATAIAQVQVSQQRYFAKTRFLAADYHLSALGQVILAAKLLETLRNAVLAKPIHWLCPAKLAQLEKLPNGYKVLIKTADDTVYPLTTRLLVAADGSQSAVRKALNIPVTTHHHTQRALLTTVGVAQDHQHIAYERFTADGPLAALPLNDKRCAIVWTLDAIKAHTLLNADETVFCSALQTALGGRLGRLANVSKRQVIPLYSQIALEQIRPNLVLLGNAAHTLHPVAAQGLNLGLADVAALAQVISEEVAAGQQPGELAILEKYYAWRQPEQQRVMTFTASLTQLFAPEISSLNGVINLAMAGLESIPALKQLVAKQAMGLASNCLPKLMCGIKLS